MSAPTANGLHDGEWLSEAETKARLDQTWSQGHGWRAFFTTVDHKRVAKRYFVTAFVFFFLAGVLAFLMRLQLARPENTLVGPDLYNQIFTMHGSTMMFLFAVPIMEGLAVYFVPLMCGSTSSSSPRLGSCRPSWRHSLDAPSSRIP